MQYTLKNSNISATFKAVGAELISFKDDLGKEYLWQADAKYWKRHAPILFPMVGQVREGHYTYKGQSYTIPQHGFARDAKFQVETQTADCITFSLTSSPSTKTMYPFDFCLKVIYTLKHQCLEIAYEVINTDTDTLYFKIGAHPAFNCPETDNLAASDYYLSFEQAEDALQMPISEEVLIETHTVPFNNQKIFFKDVLAKEGVLILKEMNNNAIALCHPEASSKLKVSFKGFPFLGIWSPSPEAPFVCIEPWQGHADYVDESFELTKKRELLTLAPGEIFKCMHSIELVTR